MDIDELRDRYVRSARLRWNAATVTKNATRLADFTAFARRYLAERGAEATAANISREVIEAWQRDLEERTVMVHGAPRRLSQGTRNLYATALRNMLTFGADELGLTLPRPNIVARRRERRQPTVMVTREDVERMLRVLPRRHPGRTERDPEQVARNTALVQVLWSTGGRLAEIAGMRIGDVDMARGEIRVIGKRDRERVVWLTPDARAALRDYLRIRKRRTGALHPQEPLFTTQRPISLVTPAGREIRRVTERAISPRMIEALVAQLGRAINRPEIHPHSFRHGRLTVTMRHAGPAAAQSLAGHASVATTVDIYGHLTREDVRRAVLDADQAERRRGRRKAA